MSSAGQVWIGADPGGKRAFGIAILRPSGEALSAVVNCTDQAVAFVQQHVCSAPGGIGVDAPLWWSSGPSSDRYADQWLRKRYKLSGGEVQAANSLRGAALVQAAMFVERMRKQFAGVPVTEVHPKALLKTISGGSWETFANRHRIRAEIADEHARDAVIAAVAAREGFTGQWKLDLSVTRQSSEEDPQEYRLAPVHYFWPKE